VDFHFFVTAIYDALRQRRTFEFLYEMISVYQSESSNNIAHSLRRKSKNHLEMAKIQSQKSVDYENYPLTVSSEGEVNEHVGRLVMPKIDISYNQNVLSWVLVRQLFQRFGERFRLRLDLFVGEYIKAIL
jgi:hypothetical protein